jgi:1,3-propanediol dehydrogenase/alcohol dehydrogenase
VQDFVHHMPTRVVGGVGALARLPEEVGGLSRRCLVVCGQRSARLSGSLSRLLEVLGSARMEHFLFDKVEPNPTVETIEEGVELARTSRVHWVLGLGGGSAIDAAKAIALMAVNQGDIHPFFEGMRPENPPFPVVAIPTTSGTGSEVTPFSVITHVKEGDKFAIVDPGLFPRVAILDPELTLSMPEVVTVDSGLDALCHAIEALVARQRTPCSDITAREALVRVQKHLPEAKERPDNLEARAGMQFAACLAGMAIADSKTCMPHGMGFPITVRYGIPHGRVTALLQPAFLERIGETDPEVVSMIGTLLGDPQDAPGALRAFLESVGVAPHLRAYGVREQDIEAFASQAKGKQHALNSPGEWPEDLLQEIYRRSL